MERDHRYFLKIDIINTEPAFIGLFDSRIKNLRERIENEYLQLFNEQQKFLSQEKEKSNKDRKVQKGGRRYAENYVSAQSSGLSELDHVQIRLQMDYTRNNIAI